MGNHKKNLLHLMVIGCALGASLLASLPARAEGNGVVVLTRDVKTRDAFRKDRPDPNPLTVNTNESARITAQTSNELSDGDFASVASGATIVNRLLTPDSTSGGSRVVNSVPSSLPGLGNTTGGGGGGATGGIANTVNSGIQRGMAPLQILTGGR